MYSTEALHRYNALVAAGFELDLASETGSYVPDTRPIDARFMLAQDGASFKGPAFAVNVKLRAIAKAGEDFFITSGRIVTGANPFSATSTALKAIAAFEAL